MALFTVESARLAGRKSVLAKKAKKIADAQAVEAIRKEAIASVVITVESPIVKHHLTRTLEHLERCNKALARAEDDNLDALSRAHERFFKEWVWLAGIAGPGQFKPERSVPPKSLGFGPLISNNPPAEQPVDVQPLTPSQPGAQELEAESSSEPPPN